MLLTFLRGLSNLFQKEKESSESKNQVCCAICETLDDSDHSETRQRATYGAPEDRSILFYDLQ